jgi:acylphosphatase
MVQGVGYRWFVRDTGKNLALGGWVRNLSSGDVEIEVEGNPECVNQFLEQIRNGHPYARVDELSVEQIPLAGEGYTDFKIKY